MTFGKNCCIIKVINGENMFKIIIGIVLGIVIVTYYPQISTTTKQMFLDSGARDEIVKSLKEVK